MQTLTSITKSVQIILKGKKKKSKPKPKPTKTETAATNEELYVLELMKAIPEIKFSTKDPVPTARPFSGQNVRNYNQPSNKVVDDFRDFLVALASQNTKGIQLAMIQLNLKGFVFKDHMDVVFFGPKQVGKVAVNMFWRFGGVKIPGDPLTKNNPVDAIILEAPHEGSDNTLPTSISLFLDSKAKVLLGNSVSNKDGTTGVKCQKTRKTADGAHCVDTLFHKVHSQLSVMYPYGVYPQLHGMKGGKNFHMLVVNSFNSNFNGPRKSGPLLFGQACAEGFPSIKQLKTFAFCGIVPGNKNGVPLREIYRRPTGCHNSNVNAHQLNGGSQCSVGVKDTGRFIHIEMDPTLRMKSRTYKANIRKLTASFIILGQKWSESPDEDGITDDEMKSFVLKDDDMIEDDLHLD